jgi:hypothetical protein
MLYSLLLSLTQPAAACVEPLSVSSVFPATGTMSVPVDSHFFLSVNCQSFSEVPTFVLEQDGEAIEIDVTVHQRDISVDSRVMMIEVAPVEELSADAMLLLSMDYFGMQSKVATFVTADFIAPEVTESAPEIWWMETYDVYQEETDFECMGTLEQQLYLDLTFPESDDVMMRIYEVDPALRDQVVVVDSLQTPFHEIHKPTDFDHRMIYVPEAKVAQGDMCFTATFVNAAGQESEAATVQCLSDFDYIDEFYCGTGMGMMGCSSMPASEMGWMALLMGAFGFMRRRQ